jgi:hypothetical protein
MIPSQDIRKRAGPLRVVDSILAVVQDAFADPLLCGAGMDNPFLFNPEDPVNSRLWITDPGGRVASERSGARSQITVERGEYVPGEMHLQNYAGGSMSADEQQFTDLTDTSVFISCEGGSRTASEALAWAAYLVLKLFRRDIMRDLDLMDLKLSSIGVPSPTAAPGFPWQTIVTARVKIQEHAAASLLANQLSQLAISTLASGPTASQLRTAVIHLPPPGAIAAP